MIRHRIIEQIKIIIRLIDILEQALLYDLLWSVLIVKLIDLFLKIEESLLLLMEICSENLKK